MAIDAREYEANNNSQLPTMATPLAIASKNAVRVAEPLYLREFPNCVLAWVFPQSSATSFVQNVGVAYWTLDTGA